MIKKEWILQKVPIKIEFFIILMNSISSYQFIDSNIILSYRIILVLFGVLVYDEVRTNRSERKTHMLRFIVLANKLEQISP